MDTRPTVEQDRTGLKPRHIALFVGLLLFFTAAGIGALWCALSSGNPLKARVGMSLAAALMLLLPLRFAYVSVRRKWTTGMWTISPQERQARRTHLATREPTLMARIAYSPIFDKALNGILVVLPAKYIWDEVRAGEHPYRYLITALWLAMMLSALWRLTQKSPPPPDWRRLYGDGSGLTSLKLSSPENDAAQK